MKELIIDEIKIDEINHITQKVSNQVKTLSGKTVLVTGATGMIGGYLIDVLMNANRSLGTEIRVVALARNMEKAKKRLFQYMNDPFFRLAIQDVATSFDRDVIGSIDFAVHAASNTHPNEYSNDPVGTIESNVIGLRNIYEYIKDNELKCRVLCLSSVEIYGESRGEKESFSEDDFGYINCNTLRAGYPESKRLCETMAQAYLKQYGIETVIARLSRVYGPGLERDDSKALTQFLRKAVNREDIILKSAGNQVFSYVYVADAVTAMLYVLCDGETGEVYNIAAPVDEMSLKDIVEYLAEQSGTSVRFEIPDQSEAAGYSTATRAVLDTTKIENELGWHPEYDLKGGLKKTLDLMKDIDYSGRCV